MRCNVYEGHSLVAQLDAEDGHEPHLLSGGQGTVEALQEIHIQLGDRIFLYEEGRVGY